MIRSAYALSMLNNVELRLYEVKFHLKKPEVILGTINKKGIGMK